MRENRQNIIVVTKRISAAILSIGFIAIISGYYESGLAMTMLMSTGIGIMAAATMLFYSGLFLALMEEICKNIPAPKGDQDIR